ncbi:iron chelate uptake ABC transporter family permease subunit [Tsukamurella sp. 8F]|uniref:iron chelate uptake ABC transporter family permease subunit n=1 Tax=unclassified Tsukamurella TaxID=2633480 RepID=UPI0023B94FFE|nr:MULTISPECIES: iron chelate uptake ABC transporter family permease subunit [unclassified Tsukamurella]MDF0531172.1 iron chelate uptake ABC transporter family permease subunit [Tsukamurella sp. 8J]MDF0585881.1 iron chelate uptake ABC transporter family permease subunit [Tsukamurella sp. 8F]
MSRDATTSVTAPDEAPASERAAPPSRRGPRALGLIVAVCSLLVLVVLSLAVGSKAIPVSVVWDALFHSPTGADQFSVRDYRLPRTVVGLIVGISLGVAGALIQALTRNPLAEPGILGVNAGAAFAVALAVGVIGIQDPASYMWFAFAGALVVTVMVLLLGGTRHGRESSGLMVLAGVALGAVLGGATSGLTLIDPEAFDQMRQWHAGSIVGRPLDVVWPILPFFAGGLLLALAAAPSLNAMALGDDLAVAQGARVNRTRIMVVAAITFLAGGATALAGPIGFVGLMVPHVARWIVGPDQRWIIAYSVLLAPSLLLASDIAGRVIMIPSEIPVGVVTAFIGAPILIVLVRRVKVSGL